MTQQPLFVPGSGNREDVQTRLLSRRTDPTTSRQAARRTREKLSRQHEVVLYLVKTFGPGTCREIAQAYNNHSRIGHDVSTYYHIIQRRIKALAVAGYVREVGKREGSRIWSAT